MGYKKVMESVLNGILGVEVYLDDILCHAPSQAEHDAQLREVLRSFEVHRLRVNWVKCVTSWREISFLGHGVSATGCRSTQIGSDRCWRRRSLRARSYPAPSCMTCVPEFNADVHIGHLK